MGLLEAGHCVSFALGLVSYKFEFTDILININAHLTPSQLVHPVVELPSGSQPTAPTCVVWSWCLKDCIKLAKVEGGP